MPIRFPDMQGIINALTAGRGVSDTWARAGDRAHQKGMQARDRRSQAGREFRGNIMDLVGQSRQQRFQTGEREATQAWQTGEAQKDRDFEMAMEGLKDQNERARIELEYGQELRMLGAEEKVQLRIINEQFQNEIDRMREQGAIEADLEEVRQQYRMDLEDILHGYRMQEGAQQVQGRKDVALIQTGGEGAGSPAMDAAMDFLGSAEGLMMMDPELTLKDYMSNAKAFLDLRGDLSPDDYNSALTYLEGLFDTVDNDGDGVADRDEISSYRAGIGGGPGGGLTLGGGPGPAYADTAGQSELGLPQVREARETLLEIRDTLEPRLFGGRNRKEVQQLLEDLDDNTPSPDFWDRYREILKALRPNPMSGGL